MNSVEGGSKKVSSPSRVHSSPSAAQVQAQAVDSRAATPEREDASDDSRLPVKINLVRRRRSSSLRIHNEDVAAANEQLEKLLAMVDHQDEEDGTKLRAKTNLKNLLLQRIVRHQQHQYHQQESQAGCDDKKALLDSSNSSRSVNSLSLHQEIELPLDNPFENFHARVPHSEKPASSEQQQQQQQPRSHFLEDEQPAPVLKRVSSFHKQNSQRKFILPEEFVPETPHQLDDSIKRVSFQGDDFDRDDYGYSYDRSFSDDSSLEDARGSEDELEEEEKDEEALDRSASSLSSDGTVNNKDSSQGRVLSLQTSCPNFSSSRNSDNDNYSKGILKHSSHSGRMVGATKGILKRSQFNRRSSVDHPMISAPNGNGSTILSSSSRHHNHRAIDENNGRKGEEDLTSSMPNLNSQAFEDYNNGFIHPSSAPFKRPQFRPPLTTNHPDTDGNEDGDDKYDANGHKKSDLARRGRFATKAKREEPHEKQEDLGMSMDSLISADSNKTQDTSTTTDSRNHKESGIRRKSHRSSRSSGSRHRSNSTESQGSEVPFKDKIFVPLKVISPKNHRAGSENRRTSDSGNATGSGGHGKHQNEKHQDKSQSHRAPSRSRTHRHRSASDVDAVEKKTRSSNASNDHVDASDNANATAIVSGNAVNTNKEEAIATIRKSKSFVINHHRVGALAATSEYDGTTTRNTAGSEEIVTLKRSKSFFNHDRDGTASAANNDVARRTNEEFATIKKSKSFFNHHLEEATAPNSNAKGGHDRGDAMDSNTDIIAIKKSKSFVNREPSTAGKSKENSVPTNDANDNTVTITKSKSFIDHRPPTSAEDNHDSSLRRHSSRPRSRGRHHHNRSQAEDEKERQQRCDNKELNRGTSAGLQNNDDDKREKKSKSKTASSSKDKRPSDRHRRSSTGAIDNGDHENHQQQGESPYNRRSSADNPIPRQMTRDASFVAPPPPPPPPPRKSSRKSSSGKRSTRRSLSHSASSIPPPPPPPPHPSNTSAAATLSHRRSSADLLTNQAKQMLDGASYQNFDGVYCVATSDNIADPSVTDTPTSAKARSSSRHRARATSHGPVSTAGAVSSNVAANTSNRRGSEHRSKSRSKRDVLKIEEGKKTWTLDGTNTGSDTTKNNSVANVTSPTPLRNSRSSSSLSTMTTVHQRKSLSPNEVVVTDYRSSVRTAETNTTSSSLESFGAQVEESSMY